MIYSRQATNEDCPLDLKSLMMHPNTNYRLADDNEQQYKFKNVCVAIVTKFTPIVG